MRARNIKSGFFLNEELSECRIESRLLFIGLWCFADKSGKFEWKPKKIKATIFPFDNLDIESCLNELNDFNLIMRYEVTGISYGIIPKFGIHQKPHQNEVKSTIPSPVDSIESVESTTKVASSTTKVRSQHNQGHKHLALIV